MKKLFYFLLMSIPLASCQQQDKPDTKPDQGTFAYDSAFIKQHDTSAIILHNGEAKLIVSPKYQAKVFTSTLAGDTGCSLGWIHYKAFDGRLDPHMNAYGGENRFWLGPEGGPMSLFFKKGTEQKFEKWHTPPAYDSEAWTLVGTRLLDTEATFSKTMELDNYAGQHFSLRVDRIIRLLGKESIEHLMGIQVTNSVKAVAYRTENTVTNTGTTAWNEQNGLFCTWILDMFPPSDKTVIVIPFKKGDGKPATTDYFGEIPADRLKIEDSVMFFRADGKQRGKLGVHPGRALPFAGSYDTEHQLLTIIQYDVNPTVGYLNQEWRTDKPLLSGDAMNAYNDGPLATGGQLGPFYELESVSSPHYCAPNGHSTHWHTVYHFSGTEQELDHISTKLLGVSLEQIKKAF